MKQYATAHWRIQKPILEEADATEIDNGGDYPYDDNSRNASAAVKVEVNWPLENSKFQDVVSDVKSIGEHVVVPDDGNQ